MRGVASGSRPRRAASGWPGGVRRVRPPSPAATRSGARRRARRSCTGRPACAGSGGRPAGRPESGPRRSPAASCRSRAAARRCSRSADRAWRGRERSRRPARSPGAAPRRSPGNALPGSRNRPAYPRHCGGCASCPRIRPAWRSWRSAGAASRSRRVGRRSFRTSAKDFDTHAYISPAGHCHLRFGINPSGVSSCPPSSSPAARRASDSKPPVCSSIAAGRSSRRCAIPRRISCRRRTG